jgi:hypothetical protein
MSPMFEFTNDPVAPIPAVVHEQGNSRAFARDSRQLGHIVRIGQIGNQWANIASRLAYKFLRQIDHALLIACNPSIGLVISGDAVYNNTHPYRAECDEKARAEWLRALDKIEALPPKAVIAGHGVLDPDSSPRHIEQTRNYLSDFNETVAKASTPLDLYAKMLALHPNRINPGSLWATATAVKGS